MTLLYTIAMHIPQDIQLLIEKYLNGSATKAERQLVNNWYQSFHPDEMIEIETSELNNLVLTDRRIKEKLLASINKENKRKNRWWMRSAAAVFLLSIGIYFFVSSDKKNQETSVVEKPVLQKDEIVPGGNRALLTLADGSTIVLDSAKNGLLTQQGGITVKKLDNGLLAYTVDGKLVSENDPAFYNTITTPRGGQYQVTLSDGTQVWLNASSSIKFPVVFTGKERKVIITGEAYFEVASQITKGGKGKVPFKVTTPTSEVEVIGTHFNVNSYSDEPSSRTTLLEGKVKVTSIGKTQSAKFLYPGQQTVITNDGNISVINNADIEQAIAWKNGLFQFKSTDLKTILRQISRWYDADIQYRGNVDIKFTGNLPRKDNVNKIFENLALTGEVKFKVDGKKIIVSR